MGIRLAIASIPQVGNMWKTSMIYMAALHYILFNSLRGYNNREFLKYHKGSL